MPGVYAGAWELSGLACRHASGQPATSVVIPSGLWHSPPVQASLLKLRHLTYGLFVELGRAPTRSEAAASARLAEAEIAAAWRELHDQHALVLDLETTEIRMANPFSAVPTPYRVQAGGRAWYANCAWDAFGICAALHSDGHIATACPDCGQPLSISVRGETPDDPSLLFHCLVPAARWWDNIIFT
jgi:hypothetical protein